VCVNVLLMSQVAAQCRCYYDGTNALSTVSVRIVEPVSSVASGKNGQAFTIDILGHICTAIYEQCSTYLHSQR
jgi:hypothetical protein